MYASGAPLPPGLGNTSKQTYVKTETSSRMPDFVPRSGEGGSPYHVDGDEGSALAEVDANGHRLRRKYTTTTVTTVTTTTILLPKMQDAVVFDPVTQHYAVEQPGLVGGGGGRPRQLTNGGGHDADQRQQQLTATTHQPWAFKQDNQGYVDEGRPQARPPTLQELGISSYFNRGGSGNNSNVKGAIQNDGYVRGNGSSGNQPWVVGETRAEVEGGMGVYYP